MPNAIIRGTGSYLPSRRVSNREVESWTFTSSKGEEYHVTAEEIVEKTGILERRYSQGETMSDMAAEAGKQAISSANIHPDDIDLVLLATSTPDYRIPKSAPYVAHKIGLHTVPAYDFGKDCTGWIEALEAASYYIRAGRYQNILIIGADRCSSFINPKQKGTALLFGDGAGAAVLTATEAPNRGFLSAVAGGDGEQFSQMYIPLGGSSSPYVPDHAPGQELLVMNGNAMAKYGRQIFAVGVERALSQQQLVPENLDLLIPHQASKRVIEAAVKALDLPMSKVALTLDRTGDTGAASVPIALDHAVREGRLREGYLICLMAYGGGLAWISALMRW